MRLWEILEAGPVTPRKPQKPKTPSGGGVPPLTPEQSRTRSKKQAAATAKVSDTIASNAIKLRTAQQKLADI
jgi:hypothetical protein